MEIAVASLHIKEAVTKLAGIPGLTQKMAICLAEKGYCSIEDLKNLDEEKLGNIEGFTKVDASAYSAISSARTRARSAIPAAVSGRRGQVPHLHAQPESGTSKERLIPYLLRVPRMNKLKAEMVYDAGYDSVDKIQGGQGRPGQGEGPGRKDRR